MWRSITITLLLLVLAQSANALPISVVANQLTHSNLIEQAEPSQVSLDLDEKEDLFHLPRLSHINVSLFSNELQTTPSYFFVVEFFQTKLATKVFKNLANPPVIINWYEQLSHSSYSARLSGWKDGNSLYTSRITYHS